MKMKWLLGAGAVLFIAGPVSAQTQMYSALAYSNQGSKFTLVIRQEASRLRFDLDAVAGATSLSGLPRCQPVDLRPDGSFLTYCAGFQAQDPGQYILQGNLDQRSARLDTVYRFGGAEFKLEPGPLPKR